MNALFPGADFERFIALNPKEKRQAGKRLLSSPQLLSFYR